MPQEDCGFTNLNTISKLNSDDLLPHFKVIIQTIKILWINNINFIVYKKLILTFRRPNENFDIH